MHASHRLGAGGLVALLAALGLGCGSSAAAVTSGPVDVIGEVRLADGGLATGVDVTLRGDFDGNGAVAATEVVTVKTDAEGFYKATVTLAGKTQIRLTWSGANILPNHKAVAVTPPTGLRIDAVVAVGEAFEPDVTQLALPGRLLRLKGLPKGVTGVGRVFNPVYDGAAFPGEFVDDKGTPIRSAVFATMEMKDSAGQALTKLSAPATLTLDIPAETWRVVVDMVQGNGKIDVPKYFYDTEKGAWVQEGLGHLVDDAGEVLPESALTRIHDGSLGGGIAAVYEVTHFSTYNVDFPQTSGTHKAKGKAKADKDWWDSVKESYKCLTDWGSCGETPPPPPRKRGPRVLSDYPTTLDAVLRDGTVAELTPMVGATVYAEYYYADGTPAGHAGWDVDADGSFTLEMPRSEGPSEDLDENGTPGEVFYLNAWVEAYGLRFQLLKGVIPVGESRTIDLGELDLSETLLEASLCSVSGVVKYKDGAPAADFDVWFTPDRSTSSPLWETLCGADGAKCVDARKTGSDGSFQLSYPMEQTFTLNAQSYLQDGVWEGDYWGAKNYFACPTGPVTLTIDAANVYVMPALTVAGQSITWAPSVTLDSLQVWDSEGAVKWVVHADSSQLAAPITYGTLPAGTYEDEPAVGTLQSGDYVSIYGMTTDSRGYPATITRDIVVP